MDIQKEREAFQKFCEENFDFERHEQTYFNEQTQCYENDIGEDTESINMAWAAWQAAKAQVSEGYVVVPMEPTEQILNRMTNAPIEVNHLCDNADIFLSEDEARIAYKAMIEALEQKG